MRSRLAVPLVLVALAGCREASPEAKIRQAFDACVKAIQAADPEAASSVLDPAFTGPDGMTRDEARLVLRGLLSQERVGVSVLSDRIEVKGSRASQSVEVLLTTRPGGTLLPSDASRKAYLLAWERREGRWTVRSFQEIR